MKSVICFEANEIPVRLVEDHIKRRPNSAFARLAAKSRTYETYCEDEIELDPWISWPTLHRGVIDRQHRILHLGQSLDWADREFPPIWRILHEAGVDVGVFGSLHSSNTPQNASDYAFYVPDYFAVDAFAHPKSMMPFQEFNLLMTRRSARNIDPGLPLKEAARFGASALTNGLSASSLAKIGTQLAEERIEPHKKIRRRNIQGIVGLDLFINLLKKKKPKFSTFYTNHVAAAMHRYWAAHFTDDYGPENPMGEEWVKKYKDELSNAMDVLDDMLAKLMSFVEQQDDTVLMLCSSLGQAAVDETGTTTGFTTVTDPAKFMEFIGVEEGDYSIANAMVPCISIDLDPSIADMVAEKLQSVEFMGAKLVQNEREIPPLSFDIKNGRSLHLYFYFEGQEPDGELRLGNRSISADEAGVGFFVHEDNVACSAHHIPEGYLAVYDPTLKGKGATANVSTLDVAPAILKHFGVSPPSYMKSDAGLAV